MTELIQAAQAAHLAAPAALAGRVERAQADQCRAYVEALARQDPAIGASAVPLKGGWLLFAGVGSPLTQAMAIGLAGPLDAADLRRLEAHLGQQGGDVQVEMCAFADPSVAALLAAHGYRVHEFNQVWVRPLADALAPAPALAEGIALRPVQAGEEALFARVVLAGFLEQEGEAGPEMARLFEPMPFAEGTECWLAWVDGEAAGGGSVSFFEGVATLFGTSVLPRFRRRGLQDALIRARLTPAIEHGCDLATSNTLPGTPSQRNMERAGFRVAYPKVVMLRRAGAPLPK